MFVMEALKDWAGADVRRRCCPAGQCSVWLRLVSTLTLEQRAWSYYPSRQSRVVVASAREMSILQRPWTQILLGVVFQIRKQIYLKKSVQLRQTWREISLTQIWSLLNIAVAGHGYCKSADIGMSKHPDSSPFPIASISKSKYVYQL